MPAQFKGKDRLHVFREKLSGPGLEHCAGDEAAGSLRAQGRDTGMSVSGKASWRRWDLKEEVGVGVVKR